MGTAKIRHTFNLAYFLCDSKINIIRIKTITRNKKHEKICQTYQIWEHRFKRRKGSSQTNLKSHFYSSLRKYLNVKILDGSSHKTKKYGDVDSSSIQWNSPIEFLYTAQASFKF